MSGPEFVNVENPDELVTMTRAQAANLIVSAQRGEALQTWIATTTLLGHTRPGHTLEYVHVEEWTAMAFVRDMVEARERMTVAADALGLDERAAS